MAHYTTINHGLWSEPSTWDLGGSAPSIGDTVSIRHSVVAADLSVIGHSPGEGDPQAAIRIDFPGALLVTGEIIVRGDIRLSNARLIIGAGGVVTFDPSVSPGGVAVYEVRVGMRDGERNSRLVLQGKPGLRATLRARQGATARVVAGGSGGGQVDASEFVFERIGDSSTSAISFSSGSAHAMRFSAGEFRACGKVEPNDPIGADATFSMRRVTFSSSRSSENLQIVTEGPKQDRAEREIVGCVFDKPVELFPAVDFSFHANLFLEGFRALEGRWRYFGRNLVRLVSRVDIAGDTEGNYWLATPSVSEFGRVGQWPGAYSLDGDIFESLSSDEGASGACIVLASPSSSSSSVTVRRAIVLPNSGGGTSGALVRAGAAGVSLSVEECTAHVGARAMVEAGGAPGSFLSFVSNIGWDTATGRGWLVRDFAGATTADLIASGDADYNARLNLAGGYSGLEFSSGAPGAHDVIGIDPLFVDPTRDLSLWDATLGGVGNATAALSALRKRNTVEEIDAYSIDWLYRFTRDGFAPASPQYVGRGVDGGDIGAVPPYRKSRLGGI